MPKKEAATFVAPDRDARDQALGSLTHVDAQLRCAFASDAFRPIAPSACASGAWLNSAVGAKDACGQTFTAFVPSRRIRRRDTIQLLPQGDFFPSNVAMSPDLDQLRHVCAAFFSPLRVVLMPAVTVAEARRTADLTSRVVDGQAQLRTCDVFEYLKRRRSLLPRPESAREMFTVALTSWDLYPDAGWSYVFGEAQVLSGVGVWSFARFAGDGSAALFKRTARTLLHEISHLFGLDHCVYHECLMNGAIDIDEADTQPLHACPVCLRKLHSCLSPDLHSRYAALQSAFSQAGMSEEASWCGQRAAELSVHARTG